MKRILCLMGIFGTAVLVPAGSTQAGQVSRQPVTGKELTGIWRGEHDGVKIKLVFKNKDDVMWSVDTRKIMKSGMATANVQADMKWVAEKEAGHVALRFYPSRRSSTKPHVIEMGRLVYLTGGGGELRLTLLPTVREQSKEYYQLVKDFPLERVGN